MSRVHILGHRPIRCFRCLELGHLRGKCRRSCCLKDRKNGHKAAVCEAKAHCPACKERGLFANHRVDDKEYPPNSPIDGGVEKRPSFTKTRQEATGKPVIKTQKKL